MLKKRKILALVLALVLIATSVNMGVKKFNSSAAPSNTCTIGSNDQMDMYFTAGGMDSVSTFTLTNVDAEGWLSPDAGSVPICIEHLAAAPSAGESRNIFSVKGGQAYYQMLRKCLYYGYGGAGDKTKLNEIIANRKQDTLNGTNGAKKVSYIRYNGTNYYPGSAEFDNLYNTYMQKVITSITATYITGASGTLGTQYGQDQFYNYLTSIGDIPYYSFNFSTSSASSTYDATNRVNKSDVITISANPGTVCSSVNVTVGGGPFTLYYKPDGAADYTAYTSGQTVALSKGEFYVTAPTGYTGTFTINGGMTSDKNCEAVHAVQNNWANA